MNRMKLFTFFQSKLDSMQPCAHEEWDKFLDANGVFWVGGEKKCPNHKFITVWDLAMKILVLGALP